MKYLTAVGVILLFCLQANITQFKTFKLCLALYHPESTIRLSTFSICTALLFSNNLLPIVSFSFGFIVIPQLLHRFYEPAGGNQSDIESALSQMKSIIFSPGHLDDFLRLQEEYNSTTHLGAGH